MNKNSKVLALKYRPQTFDDIIGQEVVSETIIRFCLTTSEQIFMISLNLINSESMATFTMPSDNIN